MSSDKDTPKIKVLQKKVRTDKGTPQCRSQQSSSNEPNVFRQGSWNLLLAAPRGPRPGLARKSADRSNPVVKNPMVSDGGPEPPFGCPPRAPAWLGSRKCRSQAQDLFISARQLRGSDGIEVRSVELADVFPDQITGFDSLGPF